MRTHYTWVCICLIFLAAVSMVVAKVGFTETLDWSWWWVIAFVEELRG